MPSITSAHNMLPAAGEAIPRTARRFDPASQSRYTYLFPHLAEDDRVGCLTGKTPTETHEQLKAFEVGSRVPLSDLPVLQMKLAPSYTYFGQFLNHDISAPVGDAMTKRGWTPAAGVVGSADPPGLDRNRRGKPATILENLANEHVAPLTLCSLYGDGPGSADQQIAAMYEADGMSFRLAETRTEVDKVFTDLMIDPARVKRTERAPDLPRAGRAALIADRRNDENLILSQLHLALMLLHNKAVKAVQGTASSPADGFRRARDLVTRHYHWLVLNDYLPNLLSRSIQQGGRLEDWTSRLTQPGRVPLEFTSAAFRFGHSMVSKAYDFNANFGLNGRVSKTGARLEELFAFTSRNNMDSDDVQTRQLPDHWVVDWRRMTKVLPEPGPGNPREFGAAERIDLSFAPDMLNLMGESDVAVHGSILFRNLMRGFHRRIAFGQALARECGVTPLSEAEMRAALPTASQPGSGTKGLRELAEDLGFLRETPAWLYFLCEARLLENGERVGVTASHIIADTVVGLIRLNPGSYLNAAGPRWHPRDSLLKGDEAEGLTSLRRLLLFAVQGTRAEVQD